MEAEELAKEIEHLRNEWERIPDFIGEPPKDIFVAQKLLDKYDITPKFPGIQSIHR